MRVSVKGSLLETALHIAAEQFRKDAAVAAREGVHRTMDAFLYQAESVDALINRIDAEGTLVIQPEWAMNNDNVAFANIERIVQTDRRTRACANCNEKQIDHIDGVKCPFESSLFKEKPS